MRRRLWLALVVAAFALAAIAFLRTGAWLVLEDELQPARAVVVLGGKVPFREMEAARLYKEGWTHEVWLTQGGLFAEDVTLAELGIVRTPEHVYSRMVLERLGVPRTAIRILPEKNANTAEEMRTVARKLDEFRGDRVILVTSSYHTRRVKALWRKLAAGHRDAIVRYTPDDPFNANHWWRDSADAMSVAREWFGLLNAWMDFPVKSEHW